MEIETVLAANDALAVREGDVGRAIETLRPANSPAEGRKIRKRMLATGVFLTLFGLASSTKEFLGCITLPIDGIFYLFGTTSHIALAFFLDIAKYFVMAGVFLTVTTLIFFPPFREEVKLSLHFKKWRTWKKSRGTPGPWRTRSAASLSRARRTWRKGSIA